MKMAPKSIFYCMNHHPSTTHQQTHGDSIKSTSMEIVASMNVGIITGLLIDFVNTRLTRRGEVLTVGHSLLLLCGETARLLHFFAPAAVWPSVLPSSTATTDVRLFRVINRFEPPHLCPFHHLAGAHLISPHCISPGVAGLFSVAGHWESWPAVVSEPVWRPRPPRL